MSQIRKRFSKEEKLNIVNQSLEPSISVQAIADRFGISANTIYNWRSKFYQTESSAFGRTPKVLSQEEQEIKRLKKELREAELERDILKKAVSIFSKNDKKYFNS